MVLPPLEAGQDGEKLILGKERHMLRGAVSEVPCSDNEIVNPFVVLPERGLSNRYQAPGPLLFNPEHKDP